MANIVYRSASLPGPNAASANKGSPLLNTEVDGNFRGINDELATKAPLASPALTGTPTAPTATAATNTTQLATTAFVHAERSNTATLTNKTLTDPTINAGGGTLVLPAATTPAQTAEGSIVWDSDSDLLTVGTGTARKTLADTDSSQDLTNKTVNKLTITAPATSATLTIANGKTFTLNNTLTFGGTDASSVAFGAGGTVAYTANKLNAFAATTSAELAGVISDETGSGSLVFATSPTLATPTFTTSATTPLLYGSDVASGNLTLSSTSNTTKGEVRLGGTGDTVKLNTTTAGFVKTNATGVFSIDTTAYYYPTGTDVAVADGGTGISTTPTNGQLLIGNGTGYTLSTLGAGTGIGVTNSAGGITVAHADTSTQASVDNSGNTFIQDITLDDFGHITAIVSGTVTQSNNFGTVAIATDSGYSWGTANTNTNQVADATSDTITFVKGGGIDLFTNTVAGTDAIKIEHADTSTQASVDNTGNTFIQDITLDTYGHITSIVSGTVTESDTLQSVTDRGATTTNAVTISNTSANALTVNGGVVIGGNLTVNGTTTSVNSNITTVDDKNLELGSVVAITGRTGTISGITTTTTITGTSTAGMIPGMTLTKTAGTGAFGTGAVITSIDSETQLTFTTSTANTAGSITFNVGGATNTTADGGGITLKGTTDKTFNWINSTSAWTSSEHLAVAAGKNIQVAGATSGTATIVAPAAAGTPTLTLPTTTGTFALTSDINNATLTMNVSGSGLSGSQTFTANQSSAATFTVTSNATSANTASTIVFRDASGNFSAGEATLSSAVVSANSTGNAVRITQTGTGNALVVEDSANPDSTPFVIDASGNVVVGHTVPLTVTRNQVSTGASNASPSVQLVGASATTSAISTYQYSGTTAAAKSGFTVARSRATDTVTRGALLDGDVIGGLDFIGDEGTNLRSAAMIHAMVDATPVNGVAVPGRLVFSTSGVGDGVPVERMRIDDEGRVELRANMNQSTTLTASITGTTLDVTAVTGTIAVGQRVYGPDVEHNTFITALGTGTGGLGTYTVNNTQTAPSGVVFTDTSGKNVIRFTDTDTTSTGGQPMGTIEWYGSDASTPGAGVKAYIAGISESATPDTAIVFGTSDNVAGNQAVERARFTSAGNLGIGTRSPSEKLHVVGNILASATVSATDFNSTSDATLKENITELSGLDLIANLNPVQFNWKDSGKKSYGLIAQEIEQLLPELVNERHDGMKGVSYIPIIAMLIDAVKKLNDRVKELEK